jgi:hypothetical protein
MSCMFCMMTSLVLRSSSTGLKEGARHEAFDAAMGGARLERATSCL